MFFFPVCRSIGGERLFRKGAVACWGDFLGLPSEMETLLLPWLRGREREGEREKASARECDDETKE